MQNKSNTARYQCCFVAAAASGGAARATAADCLAFLVEGDHLPMIFLDGSSKKIQCFAQIACNAAANQGIAELSMADHDLAQMMGNVPCFLHS